MDKQEPAAWRNTETGEFCTGGFLRKDLARWIPLYLASPKQEYQYEVVAEHADGTYTTRRIPKRDNLSWVGLTDADKEVLLANLYESVEGLITAIEAKLKEKNT